VIDSGSLSLYIMIWLVEEYLCRHGKVAFLKLSSAGGAYILFFLLEHLMTCDTGHEHSLVERDKGLESVVTLTRLCSE
jgi:hypothetical protein